MLVKSFASQVPRKGANIDAGRFSVRIARSHEAVDRHRKGIVSNACAVQVNVVGEASLCN